MILGNRTLTQEQTDVRRHFVNFFEDDQFRDKYTSRIDFMMSAGKNRLIVDIADLLDFSVDGQNGQELGALGHGIVRTPGRFIPLCELAAHDIVLQRSPDYLKVDYRSKQLHVGFEGPVGEILGPREVYARHMNTTVALEGIVTQLSPLRPRMLSTTHYCTATNKFTRKEYRDQLTPMLDAQHLPTVNVIPRSDMEGNPLRLELGLSQFLDSQCGVLQEAPESSPSGQLPRQLELRFDDDLVDVVKPGDRVVVVGMYCAYTAGDVSKSFKSIILVNHVYHQAAAAKVPRLLDRHLDALRLFQQQQCAVRPDGVLAMLSRSIAPSIYGLSKEKQAVLLMMVGGVERKAHNSHIRGDINVLLVGEPSTAKSQLLRYTMNVVPHALSTTGRGSSGVGLTAAVTVDSYTGERSLSAGAMVLADRGVLCIDEFDKMDTKDRVAMHEAMEQQTVTIAKAGIHAQLNARCSVLAAANPVYGFYSVKHKLAFNVGLPESLLSRFDLIFIVLDQHSSAHNRRIGRHILSNHLRAAAAASTAAPTRTVVGADDNVSGGTTETRRAEKDDVGPGNKKTPQDLPIVTSQFLQRYVQHARTMAPKLTAESQRLVCQAYVELRSEQTDGGNAGAQSKDGFFVTARTLEAMIRLASAHAKLRLSSFVTELDVEVAVGLLRASVHAAGDAMESREEDKKRTRDETANPATAEAELELPTLDATPGAHAAPLPPMAGAAAGTTPGQATTMMPAPDAPTPAAAAAPPSAEDGTLSRAVGEVLQAFQREQRAQAHMHEIVERLQQRGMTPALASVHRVLTRLENDSMAFESTDTEDVVYFL